MVYNDFSNKWIERWILDGTEMKGGHAHNHIINKLKHNILDKGTARHRKILQGVFGGRKVG